MLANIIYSADYSHHSTQLVHHLISCAFTEKGLPVSERFLMGESANGDLGNIQSLASPRVARKKGIWRYLPSPLTKKLVHLVMDSSIDVVICDGPGVMRPFIPVLERLEHLKLMIVLHGSPRFRNSDVRKLIKYNNRIRLIPVSRQLAGQIACQHPQLKGMVRSVSNTLMPEFERKLYAREEARNKLGLPNDGYVSVIASRLTRKKNVEFAIRAFAKGAGEGRYLAVMGDGPERERLRQLVASLRLEEHVFWLGWVSSGHQYLKAFDLFISASLEEGFGLSLLEAHAAGLPVVCSRIPAHEEVLSKEAYFFDVEDLEGCAQMIATMPPPIGRCNPGERHDEFVRGYLDIYSELSSC